MSTFTCMSDITSSKMAVSRWFHPCWVCPVELDSGTDVENTRRISLGYQVTGIKVYKAEEPKGV